MEYENPKEIYSAYMSGDLTSASAAELISENINGITTFTYKPGKEIFITGVRSETANYTIWEDPDHNGGYLFAYEQVETNCEIIK